MLFEVLNNLLKTSDQELVPTSNLGKRAEVLRLPAGKYSYQEANFGHFVGVVNTGVIGTKHKYEGVEGITHIYQSGDVVYSNELFEKMFSFDTYWYVYEEAELQIFPLDPSLKDADLQIYNALAIQTSLAATYSYQDRINDLGLDRKNYAVAWLKKNKRLLNIIPRAEIADYLSISKSSLKSFIKTALSHG